MRVALDGNDYLAAVVVHAAFGNVHGRTRHGNLCRFCGIACAADQSGKRKQCDGYFCKYRFHILRIISFEQ
ncbi:MAG: transposase [Alistipes sp.]